MCRSIGKCWKCSHSAASTESQFDGHDRIESTVPCNHLAGVQFCVESWPPQSAFQLIHNLFSLFSQLYTILDQARSPHGMLSNSIVKTIENCLESSVRRCRNRSDDGERRRRTTHELQTTAAVRADESRDLRRKLLDRITSAAGSASLDECSSRNFQRDENFRLCRSTVKKRVSRKSPEWILIDQHQ